MKTFLLTGILAWTIAGNAMAQNNPFAKTAWKIETINNDGSAVLKKTKLLSLPISKAPFQYLQFNNDKEYNTGTNCFDLSGPYSISMGNQVAFNGMDASASPGCPEPKTLSGTYTFVISKDQLTLLPLSEADNNEEPGEPVEAAEAIGATDAK